MLKALHARQDGKCMWCGDPTELWWERTVEEFRADNPLKQATFEHIILRSKGGLHSLDNGGCACAECNSHRGNISFNSFSYLTADKQRYQTWISKQMAAMEKTAILKRQRKALNEEKTRMNRMERRTNVFALACMFMHYKQHCHVDYHEQFVYTRNYIKLIGEHYGLF